jgi:hypothetical protein
MLPKQPNKDKKDTQHNLAQQQKTNAENYLYELLDKICLSVDIRIDEWELNKELLMTIINSPKAKMQRNRQNFNVYDHCYKMIKILNIKIPAKYGWFTNLDEHIFQ